MATLDFIKFINDNSPNMTTQQKTAMLSDFCENFGAKDLTVADQKTFANERIQSFVKQCVHETRKVRYEKLANIEEVIIG